MIDAFRLDRKGALITVGTKGIGLSIAHDNRLIFYRADVTEESDVRSLVDRCRGGHGAIDVDVNNSGPTDLLHTRDVDGPIDEVSPAAWHQLLDRTLMPWQTPRPQRSVPVAP